MLNVFFCYSFIWIIILILYLLGWSDLCSSLDPTLVIFIVISIIISLILGIIFRDKLKYIPLTTNKHKNFKITFLFLLFFIVEIFVERKIPILSVISGESYNTISFTGIRGLHTLISSLAIVYSFYLSYVYSSFREKRVLIENIAIICYFVILVQRQYILLCILGFINIMYAANADTINTKYSKKKIRIFLATLLILLLYGFGVFGNIRYGSSWKWNDSSMISNLGKMNDKYPEIVPSEYFWSYIYLVTPLVNLNENIKIYKFNQKNDFKNFCLEFVSDFLLNRFSTSGRDRPYLKVKTLTASTSYVRVYKFWGFLGIYIMYFFQMLISCLILGLSYKKNKNSLVVNCMCIFYFLIFSFFDNTFAFTTSSIILIISLVNAFKYKVTQ